MYLKGNFWERYCSDEAMGYSACDEHNGVEKYVVLWLQGAKRRNRCQIGFFFVAKTQTGCWQLQRFNYKKYRK